MIKLPQLFALALLVGGLSLHAMDDAAQLKTLEDELAKLTIQHDELDKEFRWWNENSVEEERELEPRYQLLWEELPQVKSQKEALQTQIKQKQNETAGYTSSLSNAEFGQDENIQWLWQKIAILEKQKATIDMQIKQKQDAIAQQCPTPKRPNTINLWGAWFCNGPSHESGKSENK
jgi:chromosome segregation ATPase